MSLSRLFSCLYLFISFHSSLLISSLFSLTCARGAGIHGDVLNVHTEAFWMDTRRRGMSRHQFCLPKFGHRGLSRAAEVHQRNPWILPIFIFSLRTGRTRHVPEFFNHSLYLNTLLSSSYPEGNCGGTKLLNGSISLSTPYPSIKNDLPLTLPCSGIIHLLSGC